VTELFEQLEHHNGLYLLSASGVGRVEEILGMSGGAGAAVASGTTVKQVLEQLKGVASKVHQIATKATTFTAYEHEEDWLAVRLQTIEKRRMFFDPRARYADWHLEELAGRRVVFDGGHSDITDRIEQLRAVASKHLATQPMYGILAARQGYVVDSDDRQEYALQLADMAAGWARQIAATQRILAAVLTFPLVVYNGRRLTAEAAAELDEKKLHHGRIVDAPDAP
jgi:hypothetical protein